MTTLSSPTRRAPGAVRAAAVLLPLLALASSAGVVMFTLFLIADPMTPVLVFTAMFLATAVTAIAAVPGLLRGDRTAWVVAVAWSAAYSYWSVYKVFTYPEFEAAPLLAAGLLLLGLLCLPATRRHVSWSRS